MSLLEETGINHRRTSPVIRFLVCQMFHKALYVFHGSLPARFLLPHGQTQQEYRNLRTVSSFLEDWKSSVFLLVVGSNFSQKITFGFHLRFRYKYQLPPGKPNHTCGGADVWADVSSSSEMFCSAGSYCPSTVQKISCSEGYR